MKLEHIFSDGMSNLILRMWMTTSNRLAGVYLFLVLLTAIYADDTVTIYTKHERSNRMKPGVIIGSVSGVLVLGTVVAIVIVCCCCSGRSTSRGVTVYSRTLAVQQTGYPQTVQANQVYLPPSAAYPSSTSGFPTQTGGYPAQQAGYHPQLSGFPQQSSLQQQPSTGHLPQMTGIPPQPASYPQQPAGYPQQPPGYPQQPPGNSQQPPGYPQQPAGFPAQTVGYPSQQIGYPSHAPGSTPQGQPQEQMKMKEMPPPPQYPGN